MQKKVSVSSTLILENGPSPAQTYFTPEGYQPGETTVMWIEKKEFEVYTHVGFHLNKDGSNIN